MTKFEYNGKIYQPSDLEKKLKSMGITKNDIHILEETISRNEEISKLRSLKVDEIKHYYCFWNKELCGWYDSEKNDLSDWPWNDKERFILIGETLNNETLNETHNRLYKHTKL